jgi:pyridoxine 5-phosphate synthase
MAMCRRIARRGEGVGNKSNATARLARSGGRGKRAGMESGMEKGMRIRLGVNIDHVATVRQARRGAMPDVVAAATAAEAGGADGITAHLREDRRHIQDADVYALRRSVQTRMNFEMGLAADIQRIAFEVVPHTVTLVPEKREEVTTEGGLDAVREAARIGPFAEKCRALGVHVSLFIDPEVAQVEMAKKLGADAIELHTGTYCHAFGDGARATAELKRLDAAGARARELGLQLLAGHGLDYANIRPFMAGVHGVEEVNIGHSIVARALFTGLESAVREMRGLLTYPESPAKR